MTTLITAYLALKGLDAQHTSAMGTAEAAAYLSEPRVPTAEPIPLGILNSWALANGTLLAIEDAAADVNHPVRAAARSALRLMDSRRLDHLDMSIPGAEGMFTALVQGGLLTVQQAGEIQGMGTKLVSLLVGIDWPASLVTEHDIAHARSL